MPVQVTFLDGRRVKARQEAPRWIDQYRVSPSAPQLLAGAAVGVIPWLFTQQEHSSPTGSLQLLCIELLAMLADKRRDAAAALAALATLASMEGRNHVLQLPKTQASCRAFEPAA